VSTVESAVDPATRPQHVSQIKQELDGENQGRVEWIVVLFFDWFRHL